MATGADPGPSPGLAHDLAEFILGVRGIDRHGRTFAGSGRGGDLRRHDAWLETCFQRSEGLLDVTRARRLWREFRDLPRTAPDVMTHGDLIPGNVLVAHGRLAGVIDVGGLGPADPALDLVGAWHLLEPGPRLALRADLGSDDVEWARGRAWAFEQAMGAVWYYTQSNPAMSRMGQRTLDRILADTRLRSHPRRLGVGLDRRHGAQVLPVEAADDQPAERAEHDRHGDVQHQPAAHPGAGTR